MIMPMAPRPQRAREVGTATMLEAKGAFVPVHTLFKRFHYNITSKDFLPAIGLYYSNNKNQLMAMPFNSSSPVLFYNKAAFKKAGLDPNKPPATWPELQADGKKLLKAGFTEQEIQF